MHNFLSYCIKPLYGEVLASNYEPGKEKIRVRRYHWLRSWASCGGCTEVDWRQTQAGVRMTDPLMDWGTAHLQRQQLQAGGRLSDVSEI